MNWTPISKPPPTIPDPLMGEPPCFAPISPYQHPVTTVGIIGLVDLCLILFPFFLQSFLQIHTTFLLRNYLNPDLWASFKRSGTHMHCLMFAKGLVDWLNEWMNEGLDPSFSRDWIVSHCLLASRNCKHRPWLLWRWPHPRKGGGNRWRRVLPSTI